MQDKIFVFYFFMEHAKHFDHWMKLAKVRTAYNAHVQVRLSVSVLCSALTYGTWMPEDSTRWSR